MNIRLFYVGPPEDLPNIVIKARIMAAFNVYADKPCVIEKYEDFRQLLSPLSSALQGSGLVVILPGKSLYETVKRSLISAMHLKCELSLDVIDALPAGMSAVEKELHAMFPLQSKIFYTKNGAYAPFACRSGKQNLVFCPAVNGYVKILETAVTDWLNRMIARPADDAEPYIKMFRLAAASLIRRNLTVAAAATKTVDFIRAPAQISGHLADCIKFSDQEVPTCDCEPQDHTARAAAQAAAACNSVLGMAMSNIFILKKNGYQQYVVYIAVSCDQEVTVSRVYSGDDEVTDFLKKAACEIFSLLNCMVDKLFVANESDDFDVF